jgi:hypothetical protein
MQATTNWQSLAFVAAFPSATSFDISKAQAAAIVAHSARGAAATAAAAAANAAAAAKATAAVAKAGAAKIAADKNEQEQIDFAIAASFESFEKEQLAKKAAAKKAADRKKQEELDFVLAVSLADAGAAKAGAAKAGAVTGGAVTGGAAATKAGAVSERSELGAINFALATKGAAIAGISVEDWIKISRFGPEYYK